MKIQLEFDVEFEKNHGGYDIWSDDMPGVYSWGKTKESACKAYVETVTDHLNLLLKKNMDIPKSVSKQIKRQSDILLKNAVTHPKREFRDLADVAIAA